MKTSTKGLHPLYVQRIVSHHLHYSLNEERYVKIRRLITVFVVFIFSINYELFCQNGPDGLPLYQEGVIYLHLDPESEQSLMAYPDSMTESTEDVYDIFDVFEVEKVELPFSDFPAEKFSYIYRVHFSNGILDDFISELKNLSIVLLAERIPLDRIFVLPNDPSVQSTAPPDQSSYQLSLIRAFDAFDLHTGGNAVVAIVDNAFYTGHEDLEDNVIDEYDVADSDSDASPPYSPSQLNQRYWSHGTHVAGIAGAVTHNKGVASPGWENKIMAVKVASDENPLDITHGYEGIMYAAMNGADVINCSWGNQVFNTAHEEVIKYVRSMGVIIIAATGNDDSTIPLYPAAYGKVSLGDLDENLVISVGSIDADGGRSIWPGPFGSPGGSNYGFWTNICSYGTSIYSTVPDWQGTQIISSYTRFDGTSMAAPQVAAIAGLMLSYNQNATDEEVIQCLIYSSNPDIYEHPFNVQNTLGWGRLDAYNALRCISPNCEDPYAIIYPENDHLCPNTSLDLTASPGASYLWSTSATSQSISVSAPGAYSVTVNNGECNAVASIMIPGIGELPAIIVSELSGVPNDGKICGTDFFRLTAFWGSEYEWSNGSEKPSILEGTSQYPDLLTYSVTVSDVAGCPGVDDEANVDIEIVAPPIADIFITEISGLSNDGVICEGASVQLTAYGGVSYAWSTGATTQSVTLSPMVTDYYTVTVTNSEGCADERTVWVVVEGEEEDCTNDCNCPGPGIELGVENEVTEISFYYPDQSAVPSVYGCINIYGTLVIDKKFNFNGRDVMMQPGSKILIPEDGHLQLFFGASVYAACGQMWQGIEVEQGGRLDMRNSIIKDAIYAVEAQFGSIVTIVGNRFDRNYIGLYLSSDGSGSPVVKQCTAQNQAICEPMWGNIFTCTGDLLPPYDGHPAYPDWPEPTEENPTNKSYAGIVIERNNGFQIGDVDLEPNYFDHLRTGIEVSTSIISIQNVRMSDILGSRYGTSGIYGCGIKASSVFVSIDDSEFDQMENGIFARTSVSSINGCTFNALLGPGGFYGTGIDIQQQIRSHVKNNSITQTPVGVTLSGNWIGAKNGFEVSENSFVFDVQNETCSGFVASFLQSSAQDPGVFYDNILSISNNGVTSFGITARNCRNLKLDDNDVLYDDAIQAWAEFFYSRGVSFENVTNSGSLNNSVLSSVTVSESAGEVTKGWTRTGIYAMLSPDNSYFCNTTDNLGIGFHFAGSCDLTNLLSSHFGSHTHGLQLSVPTSLSLQQDAGNVWHESYTYQGFIREPEENGGAFQTAQASPFESNPDQDSPGNIYFPTNLFPESVDGVWFTPSEEYALNCAQPTPGGEGYISSILVPIAKGNKDAGAYKDMMSWLGQRYLYRLLGDSSDLLSLHNSLDSFYTANSGTVIGKLDSIDRLLYRATLSQQDLNDLSELQEDLTLWIDSLSILDDLFRVNPEDSLFLVERYDSLLFYLAIGMADFMNYHQVAEDSAEIYLDLAYSINEDVSTSTDYELSQLKMNDILIRERLEGLAALSSQDWELIEEYAFACPFEIGLPVFQAQSLLSMVMDTTFPEPYCEEIEPRSMKDNRTNVQKGELIIYPNPAENRWNVQTTLTLPVRYELFDAHGVVMHSGHHAISPFMIKVDLPSGTYILRVIDDLGNAAIKSMSVIK